MVQRTVTALALVGLAAAFSLGGFSQPGAAKIDPALQALMETQDVIPVLILGSEQLLSPPAGYGAFVAANEGASRLALRQAVVAQLKAIAAAQQPEILRLLDEGARVTPLWIVNALAAAVTPEVIARLAASDEVRYLYPAGATVPAPDGAGVREVIAQNPDRGFSLEGKEVAWNLTALGAERAWRELGVFGEGVTVATIDTGVNYTHQDLVDNVWVNPGEVPNNGADDDGNGYVDDVYGYNFREMNARVGDFNPSSQHGTWTSGIAVGDGSGGTLTGVAPRARLMVLLAGGSHTSYPLAYQYAIEHGADVLTMSFSIPGLGQLRGLWRLMAEHAAAAGLVQVSGAGNFRQSARHPVQLRTPEDVPAVLAVGGVDRDFNLAPFSSTGPVEWASVALYGDDAPVKPDVVAFPGPGLPLLGLASEGYLSEQNTRRGNSFSGPHAAGVAALVLCAAPELPAWRVKAILEATATDLGDPGKDHLTGAGLLNAFAAVNAARDAAQPAP